MTSWLRNLWPFGRKPKLTAEDWERHNEAKTAALERVLGAMDDAVMHAIIPFNLGGALDMYFFSSRLPGTVFASMELINPNGEGPQPSRIGTYELVACTRWPRPDRNDAASRETDEATPFEKIERRMCGVMTSTAYYSAQAVLSPGETAEIPTAEDEPPHCIVFDEFDTHGVPFEIEGRRHGLLLIIEVHESELRFAREHGSAALLEKLKAAGAYPYSDLDRAPVI